MPKFTRETVQAFQEKLGEIDASWQQEMNLRETVLLAFDDIKRARRFKATWKQIADILIEVSDTEDNISPESIRQYYFEFSNHPELLAKHKRTLKKSSGKSSAHTSSKGLPRIEPEKASNSDSAGTQDSVINHDISGQFNLSRLAH